MKAVLLDGTSSGDAVGQQVRKSLVPVLREQGWETECLTLRELKIGPCAGDFYCWIKTPGTCQLDDDNRLVARTVMNADLMVWLTPVTFGGYSSILKKAVDHLIQNISPFFRTIDGETHHKKRYETYPDLLVIGYAPEPEPRREAVFHHLVRRNAVNFFAERSASTILHGEGLETNALRDVLLNLRSGVGLSPAALPEPTPGEGPEKLKKAVLLVGSPRTRQSSSLVLGDYLSRQLAKNGTVTETFFLHAIVRSAENMAELARTIDEAQLVTLSFPLYVDSLPAPATDALEQLASLRRQTAGGPAFTAIVNCGFPEGVHNLTALAICETFAGEAGFRWAGGLPVGSGGGLVSGQPMTSGRTARIRKSLDLAADALGRGEAIPATAQKPMEKPVIPHWMYRTTGNWGWRFMARPYRAGKQIKAQPYR